MNAFRNLHNDFMLKPYLVRIKPNLISKKTGTQNSIDLNWNSVFMLFIIDDNDSRSLN